MLSNLTFVNLSNGQDDQPAVQPIRALVIAGGCCHDYPRQNQIITKGIAQRVNIEFDVFLGPKSRGRRIAMYQTDQWTSGYDIVIHNECYGGVTDVEFVERIVKGHTNAKIPAVVIHCSMHSYRNAKTDEWRKLLGVTSKRHERGGRQLDVVNRDPNNAIMKSFPGSWKTPNGELYVIERAWPECKVLATAYGVDTKEDHPVIWTNEFQGTKVFGTTLGHHNETMIAKEWLDVVANGILWACGKLNEDGTPQQGYAGTGVGPLRLDTIGVQSSGAPTPAK